LGDWRVWFHIEIYYTLMPNQGHLSIYVPSLVI
jgi:hypothetical protein